MGKVQRRSLQGELRVFVFPSKTFSIKGGRVFNDDGSGSGVGR